MNKKDEKLKRAMEVLDSQPDLDSVVIRFLGVDYEDFSSKYQRKAAAFWIHQETQRREFSEGLPSIGV